MTDPGHTRRTSHCGRVCSLAALVLLTACETPSQGNQKARVLNGNENQVSILAGLEANPRPLADAHCARFGKRALFRDTVPADPNFTKGWVTGVRAFVETFDCL